MIQISKWDGAKVRDECILSDMPGEAYHDDICVGPSVSSSGLRLIDKKTPRHYYAKSPLNPNRPADDPEEEEAVHFRMGRAAHLIALESDQYSSRVAIRPSQWDSWRKQDAKDWRTAQQRAGMTVLSPAEHKRVLGMAEALHDHPLCRDGLLAGLVEHSGFFRDPKTGVWLKIRPDVVPLDTMLVDMKAQRDASPEATNRAIKTNAYDLQLALGGIGLKRLLGYEIDTYSLMAIETTAPFAIHVATLDQELIGAATRRLRRAINRFALCVAENHWPAWDRDGEAATMSSVYGKWEMERFDLEAKAGTLREEF